MEANELSSGNPQRQWQEPGQVVRIRIVSPHERVPSGPVALITGAGTGIGAATARLLNRRGYRIVACGRRTEPLAVLEADIGALARSVDVTDTDSVKMLSREVEDRYGRLDAVVLNAGTIHSVQVEQQGDAEWADTLRTNLDGAMHVARATCLCWSALAGLVDSGQTL